MQGARLASRANSLSQGHSVLPVIEMRLQRAGYDPEFGTATQHFIDACRAISNDSNSPRLASLVRKLFARTALAVEFAPPAAAQAESVDRAG